jgi:two-component system sensor histidine kinase TctE
MTVLSMRLRLFLIILLPLLLIAAAVGLWRITEAQKTAEELFDKNLLFTAVAVARDVALTDGDAIFHETEQLLSDAAGGPVRYHVYAPDGSFVTGYGVPPVPAARASDIPQPVTYYDVVHRGSAVRVLRMKDEASISGLTGIFTITVWQEQSVREMFARSLALRAFAVMAVLIGTVALVVWFGVNIGLRPLLDLEEAISQRSPRDLSPIRRAVPKEARGLVRRLNHLFAETGDNMAAQDRFISDAAHQLRNPIAGIRALGEAVQSAQSLEAAQARADDLVTAARQASVLAEQLLRLERLRSSEGALDARPFDLGDLLGDIARQYRPAAESAGVALSVAASHGTEVPVKIISDRLMLREAFFNLIDNALRHGGAGLSQVEMTYGTEQGTARVTIRDDGGGIPAEARQTALARFGQVRPSNGSGLGLPIAEAIVTKLGGHLGLEGDGPGLTVVLSLPLDQRPAA